MEARKCVGNRERAQTSAIEFGEKIQETTKKIMRKSAKMREKARKSAKIHDYFRQVLTKKIMRKSAKRCENAIQFSFARQRFIFKSAGIHRYEIQ